MYIHTSAHTYIHRLHTYIYMYINTCNSIYLRGLNITLHCKNKIVKINNLLVSTIARNSGNCNLAGRVGCYDNKVTYMQL